VHKVTHSFLKKKGSYRNLWEFIGIYGNLWGVMGIYGSLAKPCWQETSAVGASGWHRAFGLSSVERPAPTLSERFGRFGRFLCEAD
jgi:hypothetical protein